MELARQYFYLIFMTGFALSLWFLWTPARERDGLAWITGLTAALLLEAQGAFLAPKNNWLGWLFLACAAYAIFAWWRRGRDKRKHLTELLGYKARALKRRLLARLRAKLREHPAPVPDPV